MLLTVSLVTRPECRDTVAKGPGMRILAIVLLSLTATVAGSCALLVWLGAAKSSDADFGGLAILGLSFMALWVVVIQAPRLSAHYRGTEAEARFAAPDTPPKESW
jgi:hypothetical protein